MNHEKDTLNYTLQTRMVNDKKPHLKDGISVVIKEQKSRFNKSIFLKNLKTSKQRSND